MLAPCRSARRGAGLSAGAGDDLRGFDRFFICANVTLHPEATLPGYERVLGYLPKIATPEIYKKNPFAPLYDLSRSREILGFDAKFDARAVSLLKDGEAA